MKAKKVKEIKRKEVEDLLRSLITKALGNPGGDPDQTHMMIAAMAYQSLKHFGFDVSEYSEKDEYDGPSTLEYLKGKNIYKCNFFDVVDWKGNYR